MTEVHQFWTNLKELVLVALVEEVAAVVEVVEVLEGADHPVWEDCSRLECPS